jgi:alpha-galactosidase/6-phospho-beta-glucosidase family protein
MRRVKDVERLVVEAATTGSRDAALAAFARHPLVDSDGRPANCSPDTRQRSRGWVTCGAGP